MDASHIENVSIEGSKMLSDKWVLWAHLPHDTDWTLGSYKRIFDFETVEQAITLTETLPEKLIKNCRNLSHRKFINFLTIHFDSIKPSLLMSALIY